ncbi:hypothetical protein CsatB_013800 [Cannabis sativa]
MKPSICFVVLLVFLILTQLSSSSSLQTKQDLPISFQPHHHHKLLTYVRARGGGGSRGGGGGSRGRVSRGGGAVAATGNRGSSSSSSSSWAINGKQPLINLFIHGFLSLALFLGVVFF